MKAYYRISVLGVDQIAELLANNIDIDNHYFTLTGLDFGDGIINLRHNNEYEYHKDKIEDFFEKENQALVQDLIANNIMEHCEEDNIVEIDTIKNTIHIGYAEEFGL